MERPVGGECPTIGKDAVEGFVVDGEQDFGGFGGREGKGDGRGIVREEGGEREGTVGEFTEDGKLCGAELSIADVGEGDGDALTEGRKEGEGKGTGFVMEGEAPAGEE
jgi:hypothetical protein